MQEHQVLRTAVRLFAQKGYAGTGIRELSRELGLTSATLYHYTGTKEDLLATLMRGCLEELVRVARLAERASADPRIQLAHLIRAHVGVSAMNPQTAKVTDQEVRALNLANYTELIAMRDAYEAVFARVIEQGASSGGFQVRDQAITRLALLEMCNGVANWFQPHGRLSVEQVQDEFVGLGCRMVAVTAVAPSELGDVLDPVRLASEPYSAHVKEHA